MAEYYANVAFGYVISRDVIDKKFIETIPDKTETQPRWDPKTGDPIEPEVVITEHGGDIYVIDGEDCGEGILDFLDAFAAIVGADEAGVVDEGDDEASHVYVGISPKSVPKTGLTGSRFSVGSDYYLADLIARADKLPAIREKLKKLDLKAGEARVIQTWGIIC